VWAKNQDIKRVRPYICLPEAAENNRVGADSGALQFINKNGELHQPALQFINKNGELHHYTRISSSLKVKVKESLHRPGQALRGFRRFRLPEVLERRHMKFARLSALRAGRLYLQGNIPGTHFS
jgi:hypothetical protein